MIKSLSYLWALLVASMKGYGPDRKKLFVMSFFMILQNSMFFALWIFLFDYVKELKGWHFEDLARMVGFVASTIGLSLFFMNGPRTLAYRIQDGTLDSFIARPRAVLPSLLLSASSPASMGDVIYGPLLWALFGNMSALEWLLMIFLTLNACMLFTALTVIVYSIAFWLKGNPRFSDQIFESFVIVSCNLSHGQPLLLKLILFTLLPAAFINYVPIELVRNFSLPGMAFLLSATLFYGWVAVRLFNAGLKRYVNSMT